jgi:four helix bundle protein
VPGVRRFEDLEVYKLAAQLRVEVVTLSSSGAVARDYKFVDQIRDAARGAPRNIAEGFARCAPLEFHQFLSYAKASVDETKNHLYDGHESGYITSDERDRLVTLARRTAAAIMRLMRYLESPEAQRAYARMRKRVRTKQSGSRTPEL